MSGRLLRRILQDTQSISRRRRMTLRLSLGLLRSGCRVYRSPSIDNSCGEDTTTTAIPTSRYPLGRLEQSHCPSQSSPIHLYAPGMRSYCAGWDWIDYCSVLWPHRIAVGRANVWQRLNDGSASQSERQSATLLNLESECTGANRVRPIFASDRGVVNDG